MRGRGTDDGLLATVTLVANDPLACRDLGLELVTEDCDVVYGSFIRATHPNKAILKNRDSKLVVNTSLTRLVGVIFWVLGESGVLGLIDLTMHPIH